MVPVEEQLDVWWSDIDVRDHVIEVMSRKELRSKEAIREVAKERRNKQT